nr:phosphatase PAP2 family protein [uncultured Chryseobacterium sp.]
MMVHNNKNFNTLLVTILMFGSIGAQHSLSINNNFNDTLLVKSDNDLSIKKILLPAGLITVGAVSFAIPKVRDLNFNVRQEIKHHNLSGTKLDNYTQLVPIALVYGLNAAGVKGKHNLRDRTVILLSSQVITNTVVFSTKYIVNEERPDGSNNMSFPSGHAAIAFSTAQFMYREYQDSNIWLSLSGYPFALFTSVYRVINNKHWVTDVIAGAGVGILSTEVAYWIFPKINSLFKDKGRKSYSMMVSPFYMKNSQFNSFGFNYQIIF